MVTSKVRPQQSVDGWNYRFGLEVPSHWGRIYFKG